MLRVDVRAVVILCGQAFGEFGIDASFRRDVEDPVRRANVEPVEYHPEQPRPFERSAGLTSRRRTVVEGNELVGTGHVLAHSDPLSRCLASAGARALALIHAAIFARSAGHVTDPYCAKAPCRPDRGAVGVVSRGANRSWNKALEANIETVGARTCPADDQRLGAGWLSWKDFPVRWHENGPTSRSR